MTQKVGVGGLFVVVVVVMAVVCNIDPSTDKTLIAFGFLFSMACVPAAKGVDSAPFSYLAAPPPVFSLYTDHRILIWRE